MKPTGNAKQEKSPVTSLTETVYRQMIRLLDEEAWLTGQRLPSEEDLAQRFSVSRPVVRQALSQLKAEGRIYSRKGSGHFVQESSPDIAYNFGTLRSVPDVRLFLEFRCFLESEIAAQSAEKAEPAAIEEMEKSHEILKDAIACGKLAIQEDIDFHMAIAKVCGNRFLISTLAALDSQIQCSIRLIRELADRPISERFEDINREHQRIVDAIKSKDVISARHAMAEHLQGGIRRLFGQ